jgi:predicted HTH transcriptional regulator
LHPIVEFLAECFAEAAEEVVAEGRKILKERAGKTPEARQQKILAHAKGGDSFSMSDVLTWMPGVPRRTLERDVAQLVKKRALKAEGDLKSRIYLLMKLRK